jgi:hypothetical protein
MKLVKVLILLTLMAAALASRRSGHKNRKAHSNKSNNSCSAAAANPVEPKAPPKEKGFDFKITLAGGKKAEEERYVNCISIVENETNKLCFKVKEDLGYSSKYYLYYLHKLMTYKADGVFCLEKFEAPSVVDNSKNNSFNITFGKKAGSTKQNTLMIGYTGHNSIGTNEKKEFENFVKQKLGLSLTAGATEEAKSAGKKAARRRRY